MTREEATKWAEKEIDRIKYDPHYRPEMTEALEVLARPPTDPVQWDTDGCVDRSCG